MQKTTLPSKRKPIVNAIRSPSGVDGRFYELWGLNHFKKGGNHSGNGCFSPILTSSLPHNSFLLPDFSFLPSPSELETSRQDWLGPHMSMLPKLISLNLQSSLIRTGTGRSSGFLCLLYYYCVDSAPSTELRLYQLQFLQNQVDRGSQLNI